VMLIRLKVRESDTNAAIKNFIPRPLLLGKPGLLPYLESTAV
jgi:hypothetical protein